MRHKTSSSVAPRFSGNNGTAKLGTLWLSSGQLCQQAGVRRGVLRMYEKLGLLVAAQRSPAGYRRYRAEDVDKLLIIRSAKALGLTLREVHELLPLLERQRLSRAKLLEMTRRQLTTLELRLVSLQKLCAVLQSILDDPDKVTGPNCGLVAELKQAHSGTIRASRQGDKG